MDYADAVAYSVHDLDDFYRAGLIPIDKLLNERTDDFDLFLKEWHDESHLHGVTAAEIEANRDALRQWLQTGYSGLPGSPTWRQAATLRTITAGQIAEFVSAVELQPSTPHAEMLTVPKTQNIIQRFCQRLVWKFVIANPRLATQQHGQRRVVRTLFEAYTDAITNRRLELLPPRFRDEAQEACGNERCPRVAADIISSYTDAQAVMLYHRLTGISTGSVTALL